MSQLIEETLFDLLSQVRKGDSISPNDVAKAIDATNWRRELPKVRGVIGSIGYANIGGVSIVTGSNLGGGKVTVGDKPAPVITQLGGSILVVALPPLPQGKYPLVVSNDKGSSSASHSTTIKYIPLFRWMW